MLTASHVMQTEVESVSPELGLVDLERRFLMVGVQGFPVVEEGRLVGIVSRSDIVRILSIERAQQEQISDFYRSFGDPEPQTSSEASTDASVAARVGERAAGLHVRDAMIRNVITVRRDQPMTEVARLMLDGHIHRLPVVEDEKLVGILTTLDIVRLLADGRLVEEKPEKTPPGRLLK